MSTFPGREAEMETERDRDVDRERARKREGEREGGREREMLYRQYITLFERDIVKTIACRCSHKLH